MRVPEVKRAPWKAWQVERGLSDIPGVKQVKANPTTGSVLVLFEPKALEPARIFKALEDLGCLKPTPTPPSLGENVLTQWLIQTAVEVVLKRLIFT